MHGFADLHLTTEGARRLRQLLDGLCRDAGALAAIVLDECGTQLASGGTVEVNDDGEIAALAAGAFAATRQLALRLGEDRFDGLMHHGRERHFHLSPIDRDHLLLTIFGDTSAAGIVRLAARQAAPPLRALLESMRAPVVPLPPPPSLQERGPAVASMAGRPPRITSPSPADGSPLVG